MGKNYLKLFLIGSLFASATLSVVTAQDTTLTKSADAQSNTATNQPTGEELKKLQQDLEKSKQATDNWLKEVDAGSYKQSWDDASVILKINVDQDGWIKAMQKLRKPLGSVSKRELADIRTSNNPPGVAKGQYMVVIYNTDFSSRHKANELVTLVKESDGTWRVMSYFAR